MRLAACLHPDPLGSISAPSRPPSRDVSYFAARGGNVVAGVRLRNRQAKRAEEGETKGRRWISSIMSKADRRHWIKWSAWNDSLELVC